MTVDNKSPKKIASAHSSKLTVSVSAFTVEIERDRSSETDAPAPPTPCLGCGRTTAPCGGAGVPRTAPWTAPKSALDEIGAPTMSPLTVMSLLDAVVSQASDGRIDMAGVITTLTAIGAELRKQLAAAEAARR